MLLTSWEPLSEVIIACGSVTIQATPRTARTLHLQLVYENNESVGASILPETRGDDEMRKTLWYFPDLKKT